MSYGEEETTFTNIYRGTTSIKGKKIWDDADNKAGIRPDVITVRLLANGKEVASKSVKSEENWNFIFEQLPENDAEGNAIVYTVVEDKV
ncbi:Cna B-type domain-containing protein, partial [Streptococcus pneumoniae]|uniref:Cna B-type domain-containing protein n=1 Tax=Streptococcus pneumoniae TaxID=1313 RepID=UPI001CBF35CC|nr:Cna B-type domain-containing protein [Streptococcus pneumoniae]